MEWWIVLIISLAGLVFLLIVGLPVAIAFALFNIVFLVIVTGANGLSSLPMSMFNSVTSFTLVAVPLFVFMGELLFRTGIAKLFVDAMGKWVGRLPGLLCILAIVIGTVFGTMSGSTVASTSMLGSTLLPQMENRGYDKELSIGSIMGSAVLACLIPPSILAIIIAVRAGVNASWVLIGGIGPGLLLATLFIVYILGLIRARPYLAPAYVVGQSSLRDKLVSLKMILPVAFIIFMVTGVILLGVTTPSEAAATGSLASIILAVVYGRLSWESLKDSFIEAATLTSVICIIVVGASAFGEILAFTGATQGLVTFISSLNVSPLGMLIIILATLFFMGMFLDQISISMITIPIVIPIALAFGWDLVWFAVLMLVALGLGYISPPFGLVIFAMEAVSPKTPINTIYRAVIPFVILGLIALAIIVAVPPIATWLPGLMK